jgi:Flp pilus assembly protein TadB
MALSDRERRLLAEMEAALASDDPRLQSTLAGGDTATLLRKAPGGALAGVALIFVGIGVLFAGLISQIAPLGVAGFIVALVGLILILRAFAAKGLPTAPRRARSGGTLGDRLQQRWDQRNFE